MANIWIGDFRLRQLQLANDIVDDAYLIDEIAEYNWLVNTAETFLDTIEENDSNVVLMLGFNDCVYGCAWNAVNTESIAAKYVSKINELVQQYSDLKFYVCAIPPVDAAYPFSLKGGNGILKKNDLNEKIKVFNNAIKDTKATFIDCYTYLSTTGMCTRDGVRFDCETSKALNSFICNNFISGSSFTVTTKTEAPAEDNKYYYSNINPYYAAGYGMPNCVAYAWGRFYEITGIRPTLDTGNAEQWYINTEDGYKRGYTPQVGSIICWQGGKDTDRDAPNGEEGHVAIVEEIYQDGSILTSESGYQSSPSWWTTTRQPPPNDATEDEQKTWNWGAGSNYTFQGFIYAPQTIAVTKDDLCTKNTYGITRTQMEPNAKYIWQYLSQKGWTLNAIAALLGNLQEESKMSPMVWEGTISQGNPVTEKEDGTYEVNKSVVTALAHSLDRYEKYKDANGNSQYKLDSDGQKILRDPPHIGFGLTQWTPYTKFINWCKNGGRNLNFWDIDSQLQRIIWEVEQDAAKPNSSQWIKYTKDFTYKGKSFRDLSFTDFTVSTQSADWLAAAFAFCYERPGRSTSTDQNKLNLCEERGQYATYWYNFLKGMSPNIVSECLALNGLKLDKCLSTEVSVSFLVYNASECTYSLKACSKTLIEPTKISDIKEGLNILSIKDKLVPNTSYSLTITATDAAEQQLSLTRDFITPQDYPQSVTSISLACTDDYPTSLSTFILDVTMPTDFGYWKKNAIGYDMQLIVDGKCRKTVVKQNTAIKNIKTKTITLLDAFNHKCNIGESVQIGVRMWAEDDSGNKVYSDNGAAKTSNTIILSNKSVQPYIKAD